jgi:hypothetical protein
MRATHYAIHRLPEFLVVRFVFQPEGMTPLDDCVVVLTQERLKQQRVNLLQFLQRVGLPEGPAPLGSTALRVGETYNVGWIGVSYGSENEICFCGLSPNAITQISKNSSPKATVEVDPLVSISCSASLLKHFLADLYTDK